MQVTCPNCGKTLKTRDEFAGKMGRCPSCRTKLRIPAGAEQTSLMRSQPASAVQTRPAPVSPVRVVGGAAGSIRAPFAAPSPTQALPPAAESETALVLEPANTASVLAPQPPSDVEIRPEDLRSKYWWLYVPMFSWTILVFPLVLPPIPLGPIMVSLAWNRREWMSHIDRSMRLLGRTRKQHEFPMGWVVNVFVNVLDFFTGGLSHLFVTASLLDSLDKRFGKQPDEPGALAWVLKWLFLGNVVFAALYIACPGIIFEPLLRRIERHLRRRVPKPTPAGTGGSLTSRPSVEPAGPVIPLSSNITPIDSLTRHDGRRRCPKCGARLGPRSTRCWSPSCRYVLPIGSGG